jgi:hypothetical protein
MKKFLTVFCGGLIALTLFVTTGNTAKAAGPDQPDVSSNECGCEITPVLGADRNKLVSDLISSQSFKNVKKEVKSEGLSWIGAHAIEVIQFNVSGEILVAVPFFNAAGNGFMYVFHNGTFVYSTPL